MPVRGPAFVHDLAGMHRVEIKRFLAHRQENVAFPVLHLRRVAGDEPQQVMLGMRRQGGAAARPRRRRRFAGQRLVAALERAGRERRRRRRVRIGVGRAVQLLVDIDVRLQRQRRVQHGLDLALAVPRQRLFQPVRARRALLQDVSARHLHEALEQRVPAHEVGVADDVGGDQRIFRQAVVVHQVGAARVAGEHHLEDARMAHVLVQQLVDVAQAERPVVHAHRHAVDGDLQHEILRHQLEIDRVIFQAQLAGQLFDLRRVVLQRAHT